MYINKCNKLKSEKEMNKKDKTFDKGWVTVSNKKDKPKTSMTNVISVNFEIIIIIVNAILYSS